MTMPSFEEVASGGGHEPWPDIKVLAITRDGQTYICVRPGRNRDRDASGQCQGRPGDVRIRAAAGVLAAHLSAHRTMINGNGLCSALAVTERD